MDRIYYSVTVIVSFVMAQSLWSYPVGIDLNGELARWQIGQEKETVNLRITGNGAVYYQDVAQQAADLWSSVEHSRFAFSVVGNEGEDVLLHLDDGLENAPYASGYAEFDKYDSKQRPEHCSIHIDVNQGEIEKTILHELGHCVGLGHSLIPQSIMSYDAEANKFALDTDDLAAVVRLYPEDSSSSHLPPGCAVAMPRETRHENISLILLMAPLFLSLANYRRWCRQ